MPIPSYDPIARFLPPYIGPDPTHSARVSPYQSTILEFCQRYSHTAARKAILQGLLDVRDLFIRNGLIGFQWLSGSFVEEVETLRGRPPNDVDVVTFFLPPAGMDRVSLRATIAPTVGEFGKLNFKVDHQIVPLDMDPAVIVDFSRFWYALFAHTRMREWKGLVRVSLDSSAGDAAARASLGAST